MFGGKGAHTTLFLLRQKPLKSDGQCTDKPTYTGPESGWRGTVLSSFTRAVPHHLAVDGAAHTVVQLHIQLGQDVCYREMGTAV